MRTWLTVAVTAAVGVGPVAGQDPGKEMVVLPLAERGGRLVVPVRTGDGTELSFFLSTGSAVTGLSPSTVERIGADAELFLGEIPVARGGRETLSPDLVSGGESFDGMISPNTLNAFDVLIDLPRERLLLKPVGTSVQWEGVELSEPVRLQVFHGIILGLDVEANGTELPAMLDLGTPGVLINQGAVSEAGIQEGRIRSLRLAGATFSDVPVEVSDREIFKMFSPSGAGFVVVGATVARDCAISLSWIHKELRSCVR